MIYDHIIVGSGIAGSSLAYFLKQHSSSILVLEQNSSLNESASAAAGAFLSPLLGKPNDFKDLVNDALRFSLQFYKNNCKDFINNCGTLRIPKDETAQKQFESYKPYIDFDYEEKENGYFFPIGTVVNSLEICQYFLENIHIHFNTKVENLSFQDGYYLLNDQFKCKNLYLATGACIDLIEEKYFNIRPVWGQRIDVKTSTCIPFNYHKSCSLSATKPIAQNQYLTSIGATHHRFVKEKKIDKNDTNKLMKLAQDIHKLENIEVVKEIAGARASSVDYFPMVGPLVDSIQTLQKFPYIKKGSKVPTNEYITHSNLYVLNGLGGRGFVLSPYLTSSLVDFVYKKTPLNDSITPHRLFTRWARKLKD